ncbi:hypothetical protein H9X96_16735 [Pedobacter sp. N36a]|uniref:hypothetical protein n=1 Tax=Pedobacter sp. N36a TaxID=2767996 RepID=UPI0016568F96|nr:hypothetical protein [Pedobacter sp. N36a]MBC8987415.1 hypothetical protein [Pedobacter sp. N36a]
MKNLQDNGKGNLKSKTQEKEMADAGRKAKGAEPANQTSAKEAKKVPIKKSKG